MNNTRYQKFFEGNEKWTFETDEFNQDKLVFEASDIMVEVFKFKNSLYYTVYSGIGHGWEEEITEQPFDSSRLREWRIPMPPRNLIARLREIPQ